jgi:hypothetical protein
VCKTVAGQPPTGSQAFDFEVRSGASPSSVGTTIGIGNVTAANGGLVTIGTVANRAAPLLVCLGPTSSASSILPGWGNPLGSVSFVPGLAWIRQRTTRSSGVDVTVGAGAIQTFTSKPTATRRTRKDGRVLEKLGLVLRLQGKQKLSWTRRWPRFRAASPSASWPSPPAGSGRLLSKSTVADH